MKQKSNSAAELLQKTQKEYIICCKFSRLYVAPELLTGSENLQTIITVLNHILRYKLLGVAELPQALHREGLRVVQ